MGNHLELDEVNQLIQAVEQHLEVLELARAKLDEFKDADAYRALDGQIRNLKDQQRMLNKRWNELTQGFSKKILGEAIAPGDQLRRMGCEEALQIIGINRLCTVMIEARCQSASLVIVLAPAG